MTISSQTKSLSRTSGPFVAMAAFVIFAVGVVLSSQSDPDEAKLFYKELSLAEWMQKLRQGKGAVRAEAAEALGFLVREHTSTYGGFSDIPIDSLQPPPVSENTVRVVVGALSAGLSDPLPRVRASAAVALSWIGPRASPATPALIPCLTDSELEVRIKAVEAIGRIGPAARQAIPHLKLLLEEGDDYIRVDVAGSLRLIGGDPQHAMPPLIKLLAGDHAHYAALELAQIGDPAVQSLKRALRDENPNVRKNAAYAFGNMAGWEKLTKDKESVVEILLERCRHEDRNVLWYMIQAVGSVHAEPDRAVPLLVSLLQHEDQEIVRQAIDALADFGGDAKAALPALIAALPKYDTADAISRIGLNRTTADALRTMRANSDASSLLVPLFKYPDAAVDFLKLNPTAADTYERMELIALLRSSTPQLKPLQALLSESEYLPLAVIAELGDASFLPLLEQREQAADAYQRTKIRACARACGAIADQTVEISKENPGNFRPKSAWPETDPDRYDSNTPGHGDGFTEIIITGKLLRGDGRPASPPKFYRRNDSMLLGQSLNDETPIRYDPQTGRFVLTTEIFAAYSLGDGQRSPGPYQTGSCQMRIESTGCRPLDVQFFDEMPEVLIRLSSE